MEYKVLITTSGCGRRLGNLTKYTNSALVRVGKKPAISYVVETYPKDTKFVITVGYLESQVKDFLSLAYPDRHFEFVEVDVYDGEGSSLGYSMLQARKALQCPFIFHASDTIVTMEPPLPNKNWIGVFRGEDSSSYASWQVEKNNDLIFQEKGAMDFDYIHIGLVGIKDYKQYWSALQTLYKNNPNNGTLNDCQTIAEMIKGKNRFELVEFPVWYDVGSTEALARARETIPDSFHNLDKLEEATFIFSDFVIKFFYDEKTARNRVKRALSLKGLVPALEGSVNNFYRYKFIQGELYSGVANPKDFSKFLLWAKKNLWTSVRGVSASEFKKVCRAFYRDKTKERLKKFLEVNVLKDETHTINGEKVPPVAEIIASIDFNWLSNTLPTRFHGDFILENVIKTNDGYCLIDWRQDFGGMLKAGDMYYDLAKLNHNLTVNHSVVDKNLFQVKVNRDHSIECDILVKSILSDCHATLFDFLEKEGLDRKKVSVLTALIWLSMSPLHHNPFNVFLFYFGKYHLWRALKEKK